MRAARSTIPVLVMLTLSASPLMAQQRFTLDHFRRLVGVGGVELSPDGRTAVVTVSKPNFETDKSEAALYAVDVASGATSQLTFERKQVGSARFSPDGRTLAFLAPDSAERMQIFLLPMTGGEPRRLTSHPTGIEHFSWRPHGTAIAFASSDSLEKREGEARHLTTFRIGDQDLFLRHAVAPQHIWLANTTDRSTRRLTNGAWTLEFVLPPGSQPSSLSWSRDGRTIAFARTFACRRPRRSRSTVR